MNINYLSKKVNYHRSDAIEIWINDDILQCIVFETYRTLPLQKQFSSSSEIKNHHGGDKKKTCVICKESYFS